VFVIVVVVAVLVTAVIVVAVVVVVVVSWPVTSCRFLHSVVGSQASVRSNR